jgi:hypothetical protein
MESVEGAMQLQSWFEAYDSVYGRPWRPWLKIEMASGANCKTKYQLLIPVSAQCHHENALSTTFLAAAGRNGAVVQMMSQINLCPRRSKYYPPVRIICNHESVM